MTNRLTAVLERLRKTKRPGGEAKTPTYFQQACKACGRQMLVRVEHLGQRAICQHCGCRLVAANPPATR